MGILALEFNFYKVKIKYVNYLRSDGKFEFKNNIHNITKPMVYGVHDWTFIPKVHLYIALA
jgi:hypothetical protein